MPKFQSFGGVIGEDMVIAIQLVPPTRISGWNVRFDLMLRLGADPYVSLYAGSGTAGNGASGIQFLNGGVGTFGIPILPAYTSGLDPGNIAYEMWRTDSGFVTCTTQGFICLQD